MKRAIQRLTFALSFIGASVVGGWWLGRLTSSLSFEMPLWLESTIKAGMRLAGATDPLDLEDIETFGLFALFFAYCIAVATVLAIALLLLRQHPGRRRQ
ncbi:hypothetical protein V4C53_14905 [Paraburkholderia azotifigens]|uniref:hypothetical protein n=1 Tax=Paraburkholderia azotifigens TaxID=2057004 RepID=UPI00317C25C2